MAAPAPETAAPAAAPEPALPTVVLDDKTKVAILGCGNLGISIAKGMVLAKLIAPERVYLTRRDLRSLEELKKANYIVTSDNSAAVKASTIVIIAVQPQQLNQLLNDIKSALDPQKHLLISVVSGASISSFRQQLGCGPALGIVRAMPNTAVAIRESMTCLATDDANDQYQEARKRNLELTTNVFNSLGICLTIKEADIIPATALCACGTAFFCRAIRAAAQGGIEIGFHAEDAIRMAAQTAKGAAALLLENGSHPEQEVDKVTTPKGCTIAGLNQMEHKGFSSALIKGIVTSADKARQLYSSN